MTTRPTNPNKKAVAVESATWQWEGKNPKVYQAGKAWLSEFYATGDLQFHCDAITDKEGAESSEFSAAFQKFNYDDDEKVLQIKGEKGGKKYTVTVNFK